MCASRRFERVFVLVTVLAFSACVHLVAGSQVLPDLTIDAARLATTLEVRKGELGDVCLVTGGCIPNLGSHTLLVFATRTHNIAPPGGDLVIGPPPSLATDPFSSRPRAFESASTLSATGINVSWTWHSCHNHWHLLDYVYSELLFAGNMSTAAATAKHSFCLRDTDCPAPAVGAGFTCSNQGISAGCYDEYGVDVVCQWMVIDGLPFNEQYVLRLTVDPTNFIPEANETNNVAEVVFALENVPVSCAAPFATTEWDLLLLCWVVLVVVQSE